MRRQSRLDVQDSVSIEFETDDDVPGPSINPTTDKFELFKRRVEILEMKTKRI
jgi:hypothetical protein